MVVLSEQEESRLISAYSNIVWSLVHRFSDGKTSSVFSQEDLYQECMLVLVKHMRKCETKEQLRRFQTMDLVNAMTRYVLRCQAVRLDCNRTDQARGILAAMQSTQPFDALINIDDPQTEDDIIARMDYESFIKTLSEEHREALKLISEGYRQWEIGEMMGKTQQWARWVRKDTKRKYDAFLAS